MKRRNVNTSKSQNGERRKRPWLRRAGVVVGCLFAGAIINVLVAWGCVYAAYGLIDRANDYSQPPWWFQGRTDAGVFFLSTPGWSQYFGDTMLEEPGKRQAFPSWSRIDEVGPDSRSNLHFLVEIEAGLPLRTLGGSLLGSGYNPITWVESDGVFEIGQGDPPKTLPWHPVWPGFLINTVSYGVIVWMLFATPRAVRRYRRIKRNRCPSCGYDLRGADHGKCPECGEAVGERREAVGSRLSARGNVGPSKRQRVES